MINKSFLANMFIPSWNRTIIAREKKRIAVIVLALPSARKKITCDIKK